MSILREKISGRLRVLRAEKGFSQENMAEMLGMSTNGYAKIERGETDVSIGKLEELAQALEVDIADLLQMSTTNTYISHNGQANVVNSQGTFHIKGDETHILNILNRLAALEEKVSRFEKKKGLD